MELYVNSEKVDITLDGEKTINDVLISFEQEAAKNDATTIGIMVNGENIPAEEFDEKVNQPITEDTKIELKVLAKTTVEEAFKELKPVLDTLEQDLLQISVMLQSGKDKEANEIFARLADCIDNFCHRATLSALFPALYNKLKIDGKEVNAFFEEFAQIFADFEESLSNKDTVTTGDLCEYEIAPRIKLLSQSIEGLFS